MGRGFFHPERGYWQTTTEPPEGVISAYPEGTIEVPLRPLGNYEWDIDASEWVEAQQPVPSSDQVIAERDRRINEGTTINVPGIGDIPVSGSPVVQADLTSLAQAAQIAIAAGNPEAMFPFRDRANTTHALTPEQVVSLFMSGVDWLASVRAAAWALIDADPIPADFADDRHWP